MREKLDTIDWAESLAGITPACAGKTIAVSKRLRKRQDHPRVCGKNAVIALISPLARGSPPRVREKPFKVRAVKFSYGITPACAGKTNLSSSGKLETEDHPRVCGKNLK